MGLHFGSSNASKLSTCVWAGVCKHHHLTITLLRQHHPLRRVRSARQTGAPVILPLPHFPVTRLRHALEYGVGLLPLLKLALIIEIEALLELVYRRLACGAVKASSVYLLCSYKRTNTDATHTW